MKPEDSEVKSILDSINKYTVETFNQVKEIPEAHLIRIIVGTLKTTIKAHGPITEANIGSAAKRIASQLLAVV